MLPAAVAPVPAFAPSPAPAVTPDAVAAQEQEALIAAKRTRWYQRRLVRFLAIVAVLGTVSAFVHYPLRITSDCTIIPSERAMVRTELEGVLAEILVDEGQSVKKGDVIARIDDRALKAERAKVMFELERLEAELTRLRNGHRPEEIQQQVAVLAARKTEAGFAAKQAKRRAEMVREGVGSLQQAEDATRDRDIKRRAVAEADAALRLVKAGARPEELASHQAVIKRAQVELEYLDQKLAMTIIRAPIDGEVLTPRFRERVNAAVEAGGLVCEIANTRRVRAEIHVPQRFLDAVAVGMPALVKVESYPDHPFEGKVDFIAPAADDAEGRRVRVVVELNNEQGLLKPNMSGYGEVNAGDRSVLELATRRIARWVRVRFLL
ncbi:MAG: hypothetical protein JWP01_1939 [Myxococcales bacterium]|nr:hypothetical protein [Myxococcales bacterium]